MRRIIIGLVAAVVVVGGVAALSAFEAHVINVTATIENALAVEPEALPFGTVFPQEYIKKELSIRLSDSFMEEDRVDDVNYVIKQKPKCVLLADSSGSLSQFGRVIERGESFVCEDEQNYEMLPTLCPFLSKHDGDPGDINDTSVDAFHGSLDWSVEDTEDNQAIGRLAKSQKDTEDLWIIDLDVPCFEGMCAQEWDHRGFELPVGLEHELFGCDLWIEVTDISRIPAPAEKNEVLSLENKDENNWFVLTDQTYGTLEFNPCGKPFEFTLTANGLSSSTSYSLIYYADPWPGNYPGALIWTGDSDADGKINVSDDADLGMDLPKSPDENYPEGAKIWLVPSNDYSGGEMSGWNPENYLFEYNLINYSLDCPL